MRVCSLVALLTILAAAIPAGEGQIVTGYEPGCWARLYVNGGAPVLKLPEAPAQVIRQATGPMVEALMEDPDNSKAPNWLLRSPLLMNTNRGIENNRGGHFFYAVEYEGYIFAAQSGLYTISTISDDPVEIFVEGRLVARSTLSPEQSRILLPADQVRDAVQGVVRLAEGKWYHVSIINRQEWAAVRSSYANSQKWHNAALLKAYLQVGDAPAEPIPFHLPVIE